MICDWCHGSGDNDCFGKCEWCLGTGTAKCYDCNSDAEFTDDDGEYTCGDCWQQRLMGL